MSKKNIFTFLIIFVVLLLSVIIIKNIKNNDNINYQNPEDINQQIDPKPGSYNFLLTHGGIERNYDIYIPTSYNKDNKTPIVIYLHGGGGSIKIAYRDGLDKSADKLGFILAIPAGTGPLSDKLLTWNGGSWGDDGCCGSAFENNVDDIGFISKMIDEIKTKFNVDEKRIYATGISNGGLMSYRVACELSNKVAAVAPIAAPGNPINCKPLRPVSVMHIHGTADPCASFNGDIGGGCIGGKELNPLSAQESIDRWVEINNYQKNNEVAYQNGAATCTIYGKNNNGDEVQLCKVEGGGHVFPSGVQYLPTKVVGPVYYDLSMDQIWDFFKKHPMR